MRVFNISDVAKAPAWNVKEFYGGGWPADWLTGSTSPCSSPLAAPGSSPPDGPPAASGVPPRSRASPRPAGTPPRSQKPRDSPLPASSTPHTHKHHAFRKQAKASQAAAQSKAWGEPGYRGNASLRTEHPGTLSFFFFKSSP